MRLLYSALLLIAMAGLAGQAKAETWVCMQKDGSELFNDKGGPGCSKFNAKNEINTAEDLYLQDFRKMTPAQQAEEIERQKARKRKAEEVLRDLDAGGDGTGSRPSTRSLRNVPRVAGQISFEQFRILARGMTEGQVLSKLGSPISRTTLTCTAQTSKGSAGSTTTVVCPELWTYTMPDGWTADLTFIAGQLSEFRNSRP